MSPNNQTANDVTEQVAKGNIAIIKHTDNGETQIETPENGAEFAVYLKAAGSYDSAKASERDYLTCDENGFAQTKDMPYGIYTVHQVSGWEGSKLMPDFDVFISQNGATYRYLINNAPFNSFIKIVKQDAETGKTIPYAGAGFKIYDPDGNPVTMTFTYPTPTTIDVFYTNAEGSLVTPEKLPFGKGYSIVEVQAPYGYVLDETPVYFDVTEDNSTEESGVTVVKVDKPNMAQKGTITVEKTGEVFFGVSVIGGVDESGNELPTIYQPQYEKRGLPGAVYEIIAAEDIITQDGTVRNHKGEVVDTVTTDATGTAVSRELYLGKYEVREITAPHGMVLNPEPHCVELVYAGQNVAVTETATSFENERQKVEISLVKSIEQNEHFGIGTNGEMKNISFGLFAAEEIVSASGTSVPANGLVEIISLNEDGTAKIKTDLPFGSYYVQELATDSHYKLSNTKYPVTFAYVGQDTAVVKIAANNGKAIENDLIYGSVSGKKVDENGSALGGALIGLFRTDDGEFTKENALMTTTSAEDGSFSFENIPYGTWYVREIEQPAGFVLDDTIYPVTIGADGQVVEIKIVNRYVRGNIHLTKVDSEYPDNKLTGATFEVYKDSNGSGKLDSGDELLGTLTEKEKGEYSMNDLFHGRYFVKETKAPEGFVLDTGVYEVMIDTNGKTYEVENKAGVGFINEAMRGNLKIVKTSSDGKVKGFAFRITGANGYDIILETNDKGEIFIDGLRIGDYTISEVSNSASSMYVIPADKKATVKIGSTTIVEMHNLLRDTPKTGDTTNLPLLYEMQVFGRTDRRAWDSVCDRNADLQFDGRALHHTLVCGGSGAGKTRFYCKPNLMQANTSFVILDPKGEIVRDVGNLLEKKGYEIRVLDLISMEKSHCYNPFVYLHSDNDVQRLVTNLFKSTTPKGSQSNDPFWDTSASMLLSALVYYLHYEAPEDEQNFAMVMEMLQAAAIDNEEDPRPSPLDCLFADLELDRPDHIALKYYRSYHTGSAKTLKSIQITLAARLEKFNLESLAALTCTDELDLASMGEKKVALFAIIPDNDSSFNFLVSILYTQLFQQLFFSADHIHGGALPIPVHFLMDEFANGTQL